MFSDGELSFVLEAFPGFSIEVGRFIVRGSWELCWKCPLGSVSMLVVVY